MLLRQVEHLIAKMPGDCLRYLRGLCSRLRAPIPEGGVSSPGVEFAKQRHIHVDRTMSAYNEPGGTWESEGNYFQPIDKGKELVDGL